MILRGANTLGQLFGTVVAFGRDGPSFHAQEKPSVSRKSCQKPGLIIILAPGVRTLGTWHVRVFEFIDMGPPAAGRGETGGYHGGVFEGYFQNFIQSLETTGGSEPELAIELTFAG